jgi:ABC-type Mn2+/Zn2+ transport system permease subunit
VALNVEGMRAMVVLASLIGEAAKFVGMFAAAVVICLVFPFVMMVVFRATFLGNPNKLKTNRTDPNLPRD